MTMLRIVHQLNKQLITTNLHRYAVIKMKRNKLYISSIFSYFFLYFILRLFLLKLTVNTGYPLKILEKPIYNIQVITSNQIIKHSIETIFYPVRKLELILRNKN